MTISDAVQRIAARGYGPARTARDPVNPAMINNWLEALGDTNPRYAAGGVAPPAMTQVWTMRGLHPRAEPDDPLAAMTGALDEAGFTSVVATNCSQTYHRGVRLGERLAVRSRLVEVAGPKRTALGEGWFVTTESIWYSGDEPVATMVFRVLKFRPDTAPPAASASAEALRPAVSQDTAFFWAGTARRDLLVQRCEACGRLRHPPGPACPDCGATRLDHVPARGTGTVYSYVVHHHPPVPGHRCPFVVVLVELPEGVRMVGELLDASPDEVRIGSPVRVEFVRIDDELTLPAWRLEPS